MGIGNRIKEARLNLGYTQEELAKLLGVTKGAIANYEIETSHPKEPIMYKLIEVLKVDANYLFQDCVKLPKEHNDITLSEYNHIKKYRVLDDFGKETVSIILDRELHRTEQFVSMDNSNLRLQAAHNDNINDEGELDKINADMDKLKRPN